MHDHDNDTITLRGVDDELSDDGCAGCASEDFHDRGGVSVAVSARQSRSAGGSQPVVPRRASYVCGSARFANMIRHRRLYADVSCFFRCWLFPCPFESLQQPPCAGGAVPHFGRSCFRGARAHHYAVRRSWCAGAPAGTVCASSVDHPPSRPRIFPPHCHHDCITSSLLCRAHARWCLVPSVVAHPSLVTFVTLVPAPLHLPRRPSQASAIVVSDYVQCYTLTKAAFIQSFGPMTEILRRDPTLNSELMALLA